MDTTYSGSHKEKKRSNITVKAQSPQLKILKKPTKKIEKKKRVHESQTYQRANKTHDTAHKNHATDR